MSASVILSPVPAAVPLLGRGAAGAASRTVDDFETILAGEFAAAFSPDSAIESDGQAAEKPTSSDDPTARDDALSTPLIWFQGQIVVESPIEQSLAASQATPPANTGGIDEAKAGSGPSAVSTFTIPAHAQSAVDAQPLAVPAPQAIVVSNAAVSGSTLESDPPTPADARHSVITQEPRVDDTTQRARSSAAAEAAVASLRQLPGAGALQQAAVSQRKTFGSSEITSYPGHDLAVVTTTQRDATDAPPSLSSLESKTTQLSSGRSQATVTLAAVAGTEPDVAAIETGPSELAIEPTISSLILNGDRSAVRPRFDLRASNAESLVAGQILPPTIVGEAQTGVGGTLTPTPSSLLVGDVPNAALSGLSRATIETTASLAAQITSRLAGRATRFELGLTPEGLGRVDVTLEIDTEGQLSARLAFYNPLAATELRGRADELRRQLEDAGFTLARDALDFFSRDHPSGGERRQQRAVAYADRHAAGNDVPDLPAVRPPSSSSLTPQGVDVKV